ncbi:MAG TPA: zinc ABC transporter substrate-binding protein [Magnetospirillum sp.]|jgi:zinc transport system substrate-binding protein|nr:zinc ABC transporter substrate-binding protein [Magnetospirillum sp.]
MRKSLVTGILAITLLPLAARAEVPRVVASIQPLHSLAASVMQGVGSPDLVVTGAQSEHTYTLRPSDARKLADAQLVVLVDPNYETFVTRALKDKSASAMVALARLPGVRVLPAREGGVWEAEHDEHGHHHEDGNDYHVWLDPTNARLLVSALAERLAKLDPEHAERYQANADATEERLSALDMLLKLKLMLVADKPFAVFHDGYQYLEKRYDLNAVGSVTVDPDRPPSAKRLAALRDRLKASGTACVFREPQFPAPVVHTLAEAAGAREGVLDPQGADIPPGPDLYFTLMTRLSDALASCLGTK